MGVELTIYVFPNAGERLCVNQLHFNADKKLFNLLQKTKVFGKCDGSYLKYYTDDGWKEFNDDLRIYKNQDIVEVMEEWVKVHGDNHHNEAIYQYLRHIQCGTPVVMRWH